MKMLRCIIADDEPIAREILKRYIDTLPNLDLVASCKDAFEVIAALQVQAVDILFLDINMPKLSGLSLLKTLQNRPEVVITTAYPEYAVEGFELAVADYLLKPFSLERFIQAVMRIEKAQANPAPLAPGQVIHNNAAQSIFVKSDKKLVKVEFDAINYVEAYGNYIKIHTATTILTPQTLSEFLEKLPAQDFLRIHKSFLINFKQLDAIEGNEACLSTGQRLPIGKSFRKTVRDRIQN